MPSSSCELLTLSPGAGLCLWSSENHRSKERSLLTWTHQARSQEQFLDQPPLVSSPGSGGTVWYLLFFLLLLQLPWKGPELLNRAEDERKPLHLKSQETMTNVMTTSRLGTLTGPHGGPRSSKDGQQGLTLH